MKVKQQAEFSLDFDGRTYRLVGLATEWPAEIAKILKGESYPIVPFVVGIDTIVDIGANLGIASIYLRAAYPSARIYSFEPDPLTFSMLQRNVGQFEGITAFNFGLFDENATARLHIGKVNGSTNSIGRSPWNADEYNEIELRDVREVLAAHKIDRIDLLKIDTEGCEVPILRRIEPMLGTIKVIYVEYHSEDCRREIDTMLKHTHVLWYGRVVREHGGELCFVSRDAYPTAEMVDRMRIVLDRSVLERADRGAREAS